MLTPFSIDENIIMTYLMIRVWFFISRVGFQSSGTGVKW